MTNTPESADKPAIRTVVMAPGAELDETTTQALTELRDQQEARLVALNRTRMDLRRAIKALRRPTPQRENPDSMSAVDLSGLAALVQWPELPILGEWQSITPAASGEFLHAVTELRQEGGLKATNLTDGTHFWGRRDYGGDDLIRFSVGATSYFELRPERIPESPTGRYHSAPPADARGSVAGMHGQYHPIFFPDDKRCNLYRVFRHALHQLVNGQWHLLGERLQAETLIKLENETDDRFRQVNLSGWMPSPEFDFGLVDRNLSVWAQVEIRFDVELEGPNAWIIFSESPAGGVIVRACGWWARAV
jgi:hypothetical protein